MEIARGATCDRRLLVNTPHRTAGGPTDCGVPDGALASSGERRCALPRRAPRNFARAPVASPGHECCSGARMRRTFRAAAWVAGLVLAGCSSETGRTSGNESGGDAAASTGGASDSLPDGGEPGAGGAATGGRPSAMGGASSSGGEGGSGAPPYDGGAQSTGGRVTSGGSSAGGGDGGVSPSASIKVVVLGSSTSAARTWTSPSTAGSPISRSAGSTATRRISRRRVPARPS
jgi:hypothetical protein